MKSGIFVRTIVGGCVYQEVADFGGFASSGVGMGGGTCAFLRDG